MEKVYLAMRLMKINNKIYKHCNPYKSRNIIRRKKQGRKCGKNITLQFLYPSYLCMGKPIISKLSTNWS